jgi:hypothetical protein
LHAFTPNHLVLFLNVIFQFTFKVLRALPHSFKFEEDKTLFSHIGVSLLELRIRNTGLSAVGKDLCFNPLVIRFQGVLIGSLAFILTKVSPG